MSDFHDGDLVYVRVLGTATEVTGLTVTRSTDGVLTLLGYETEFGLFQSDDLELIHGGHVRQKVDMYLQRRAIKDAE